MVVILAYLSGEESLRITGWKSGGLCPFAVITLPMSLCYHCQWTSSAGGLWCRINKLRSVTRDTTPRPGTIPSGRAREGVFFTATPHRRLCLSPAAEVTEFRSSCS